MITIKALTTDSTGTVLASVYVTMDPVTDAPRMPKSVRVNAHGYFGIEFRANGANGGKNEAGAKRIKTMLKAADEHGIGIVFAQKAWVSDALNAPLWGTGMRAVTRTELEALIG